MKEYFSEPASKMDFYRKPVVEHSIRERGINVFSEPLSKYDLLPRENHSLGHLIPIIEERELNLDDEVSYQEKRNSVKQNIKKRK